MRHEYCAEWEDVLIRPLHRYDIEYLRKWRNRSDINKYLRNLGKISEEAQAKWFSEYLEDKDILFFVIDYDRLRTVGSLALYNISQYECEIGKLMIGEADARGHQVSYKAFLMAMGIANIYLKINEFKLTVHEDNVIAKHIYERLGFQKVGTRSFEKGGFEDEMVADVYRIREHKGIKKIGFFKENDMNLVTLRGGIS